MVCFSMRSIAPKVFHIPAIISFQELRFSQRRSEENLSVVEQRRPVLIQHRRGVNFGANLDGIRVASAASTAAAALRVENVADRYFEAHVVKRFAVDLDL